MPESNKMLDATTQEAVDYINAQLEKMCQDFLGRGQKVSVEELMWDHVTQMGHEPPFKRDEVVGQPIRVLWLYLRGMGMTLNMKTGKVYEGCGYTVVATVDLDTVTFEDGVLNSTCVVAAPCNYIELKLEV